MADPVHMTCVVAPGRAATKPLCGAAMPAALHGYRAQVTCEACIEEIDRIAAGAPPPEGWVDAANGPVQAP